MWGGVVDVVEQGVTGILVPPRNPGALVSAIEEVLSDPARMVEMGCAGYRRIAEKFDESKFNSTRLNVVRRVFRQVTGREIPGFGHVPG